MGQFNLTMCSLVASDVVAELPVTAPMLTLSTWVPRVRGRLKLEVPCDATLAVASSRYLEARRWYSPTNAASLVR